MTADSQLYTEACRVAAYDPCSEPNSLSADAVDRPPAAPVPPTAASALPNLVVELDANIPLRDY